jgi:Bardet-Biedl syndrome 1 protein
VPKKSRLAVEQIERERESAADMHHLFQRVCLRAPSVTFARSRFAFSPLTCAQDLAKLRLTTARAFVKLISRGQGPLALSRASTLRLDVTVQGLGPRFRLRLGLRNSGKKPVSQLFATVAFSPEVYRVAECLLSLPTLVPGITVDRDVDVECVDPTGRSDSVRIYVCHPQSSAPALSAFVTLPACEPAVDGV